MNDLLQHSAVCVAPPTKSSDVRVRRHTCERKGRRLQTQQELLTKIGYERAFIMKGHATQMGWVWEYDR